MFTFPAAFESHLLSSFGWVREIPSFEADADADRESRGVSKKPCICQVQTLFLFPFSDKTSIKPSRGPEAQRETSKNVAQRARIEYLEFSGHNLKL